LREEKERERKKEEMARVFFSRAHMPCWLGFSRLLGAIKRCFKGQSLNFMCT
jgi:hypothetical protein